MAGGTGSRRMAYLSYDNNDYLDRVAYINKLLLESGVSTWFEEDTTNGIDSSLCAIVFISKSYVLKASGNGPSGQHSDAFIQLNHAHNKWKRERYHLVPVLVEHMGHELEALQSFAGGELIAEPMDMTDFTRIQACITQLVERVRSLSSSAAEHAERQATQCAPAPSATITSVVSPAVQYQFLVFVSYANDHTGHAKRISNNVLKHHGIRYCMGDCSWSPTETKHWVEQCAIFLVLLSPEYIDEVGAEDAKGADTAMSSCRSQFKAGCLVHGANKMIVLAEKSLHDLSARQHNDMVRLRLTQAGMSPISLSMTDKLITTVLLKKLATHPALQHVPPALVPEVLHQHESLPLRQSPAAKARRLHLSSERATSRTQRVGTEQLRVAVRVRPFNDIEKDANSSCVVYMQPNLEDDKGKYGNVLVRDESGKDHAYRFTHALWSCVDDGSAEAGRPPAPIPVSQQSVYEDIGRPLLHQAIEGFPCCLFAYGQTGAGKSFSVMGSENDPGIVPRLCKELMQTKDEVNAAGSTHSDGRKEFMTVECAMLELYCNQLRDLLAPNFKIQKSGKGEQKANVRSAVVAPVNKLKIRLGGRVENLVFHPAESVDDILKLLKDGSAKAIKSPTHLNENSSRAHTIFEVRIKRITVGGGEQRHSERQSSIHLIDLAGSERVKKAKVEGQNLKEAQEINKALHHLGMCIEQLAANKTNIPYRDNKLTHLLQNALSGNSFTTMLCAISPAECNASETIQALNYAKKAMSLKLEQTKIEVYDPLEHIRRLKEELADVKQQLVDLQAKHVEQLHQLSLRGGTPAMSSTGGRTSKVEPIEGVVGNPAWSPHKQRVMGHVVRAANAIASASGDRDGGRNGGGALGEAWHVESYKLIDTIKVMIEMTVEAASKREDSTLHKRTLYKEVEVHTRQSWDPLNPCFYFVPAEAVLCTDQKTTFPRMQELLEQKRLVQLQIDLVAAFNGEGTHEIAFVSHRWDSQEAPDKDGEQLAAVKRYLQEHRDVKFICFWCMPQDIKALSGEVLTPRTPAEKEDFDNMLGAVQDLYITMQVLIILDAQYLGRFWTMLECWCAMQKPTEAGIRKVTKKEEKRYTIVKIKGAKDWLRDDSLEEYGARTLDEITDILARDDTKVTNEKDKAFILPKLKQTGVRMLEMFHRAQALKLLEVPDKTKMLNDVKKRIGACFTALTKGYLSSIEVLIAFEATMQEACSPDASARGISLSLTEEQRTEVVKQAMEALGDKHFDDSGELADIYCIDVYEGAATIVAAAASFDLKPEEQEPLFDLAEGWLNDVRLHVLDDQLLPTQEAQEREFEHILRCMKVFREDNEAQYDGLLSEANKKMEESETPLDFVPRQVYEKLKKTSDVGGSWLLLTLRRARAHVTILRFVKKMQRARISKLEVAAHDREEEAERSRLAHEAALKERAKSSHNACAVQ